MKIVMFLSTICIVFMSLNMSAQGSGMKSGETVTIDEEFHHNLYLAGGTIDVKAKVFGDLISAGGEITIRERIDEDVIIVGGTVKILSPIGDDLRIVGGKVTIENVVGGDLIVAGGEVIISKEAVIEGSLLGYAGDITLAGTAAGQVRIRAEQFQFSGLAKDKFSAKSEYMMINGTIEGLAELSSPNMQLGENTKLYANVEYWNNNNPISFDNALMGGATASINPNLKIPESESLSKYVGVGFVLFFLYRFLLAIIMIGLLIWLFHNFFSNLEEEISKNNLSHLGLGLLYVIGIPVAAIIICLTIIGIPLGVLAMIAYTTSLSLSNILAAIMTTYRINNHYKISMNKIKIFGVSALAYTSIRLVTMVTFFGNFISLLITMLVFGVLISYFWKKRQATSSLSEKY